MRIAFHTLGCKVNHYETEAMREAFVSRGAECVEDAADAYIVNTCTVTNIADRKSRQYIRRVKKANPNALIVVTGCYAQVEPEEVASLPEVDLVVGNGQKSKICEMVFAAMKERESKAKGAKQIQSTKPVLVLRREELTKYEDMGMVSSREPGMTRAYIKIQEGCDRFCAYCLIPYARGPVRSRPPMEIIKEAAMLLDSGARELVLTGINTALYGTEPDFWTKLAEASPINAYSRDKLHSDKKDGLCTDTDERIINQFLSMPVQERGATAGLELVLALLDAIELPGGRDFRVRLSSLEPTVVDRNDVEKIIKYRRLCHHLHLSVQNGSDKILGSMNRRYSRDDYLEIVKAIRAFDPLYGITTDIIVGFPGEDEDDFADTIDIARQAEFGRVHVFRYSPRKGTAGARLENQVSGLVKIERAERLERESQVVTSRFMEANFGIIHQVLVEEIVELPITDSIISYDTLESTSISSMQAFEEDRNPKGVTRYLTGYTGNYIRVYIPIDESEICATELGEQIDDKMNILGVNVKNPRLGDLCNVQLTQIFEDGCLAVLAH